MRHGETFASKTGVPYGEAEFTTDILPEGVASIKRVAEYLKSVDSTKNYTSEIKRCVQTSEIVTDITGKKFEKFPLLNEFLEESFKEFKARAEKLVEALRAEENTYLLCTHGAVISALTYMLTNKEYAISNLMDYPRPGTLVIIRDAKHEVLDFN